MTEALRWLARYALWVYLLTALGALVFTWRAISYARVQRQLPFRTQREEFQQLWQRSRIVSLIFLALGAVVYISSTWVVPALPVITPTARPIGLYTPTPTPTATSTPTVTPTPGPTPEKPPTPTPTPTPIPPTRTPSPEDYLADCSSPNAQVVEPVAGSTVKGLVELRGTARTLSFSHYTFEVIRPGETEPRIITQFNVPVVNGSLGFWDVSDPERYPPGGPYRFRLVVADIYGNISLCTIPVNIAQP